MSTRAERFRYDAERTHPARTPDEEVAPEVTSGAARRGQNEARLKSATARTVQVEMQLSSPERRHELRK